MADDEWLMYLVSPNAEIMESRNRFIRTLRSENTVFVIDFDTDAYEGSLDRLVETIKTEYSNEDSIPKLTE